MVLKRFILMTKRVRTKKGSEEFKAKKKKQNPKNQNNKLRRTTRESPRRSDHAQRKHSQEWTWEKRRHTGVMINSLISHLYKLNYLVFYSIIT